MQKAYQASKHSYSPYSKFAVGSAVLSNTGRIYLGANIENISYGLTNCAERSALFNAISNGEKQIKAIAIWAITPEIFPCGACCQVILEIAKKADIVINMENNNIKIFKITDLLPYQFSKQKF